MRDKRRATRANVSLEAVWDGSTPNNDARVADLSESGCFIDTIGQANEGEVVFITALLPKGDQLQLKGIVAHHMSAVGFGVRFIDLSDEAREKIRDLVYGSDTSQEH